MWLNESAFTLQVKDERNTKESRTFFSPCFCPSIGSHAIAAHINDFAHFWATNKERLRPEELQ